MSDNVDHFNDLILIVWPCMGLSMTEGRQAENDWISAGIADFDDVTNELVEVMGELNIWHKKVHVKGTVNLKWRTPYSQTQACKCGFRHFKCMSLITYWSVSTHIKFEDTFIDQFDDIDDWYV